MVYCAAFGCNANSSENIVACSSFKFPTQLTLLKECLTKLWSFSWLRQKVKDRWILASQNCTELAELEDVFAYHLPLAVRITRR